MLLDACAKGQVCALHRDCSENLQVSDAFRGKIHQIWPLEPSKLRKNRCQRDCQSKATSKTSKKYGFYQILASLGTPNWSWKSWKFGSEIRTKNNSVWKRILVDPKIDEISSFGALRFTSEFQAAELVIFGGAQSWKSLILLSKNKVFRKIDLPLTGTIFGRFSRSKILRNPLKFASKRYCFFDLVFEANFHDFRLQFGVPKLVKIR